MRLYLFVVSALLSLSVSSAQPYADVAEAYAGDEGVRVALLPPAGESGDALVRIERTGSELDGLVLRTAYQRDAQGQERYTLPFRGRDWSLIYPDAYYGDTLILQVPGQAEEYPLFYDEQATAELNVAELVRAAERDQADVQAISAFERSVEEARVLDRLAEEQTNVMAACNYRPEVSVAWDTVSDETLVNYSIQSYAALPLNAMVRLCQEDSALAQQLATHIGRVAYRFGEAMALSADGNTLLWSNNPEAPNQEDFVYNVLKNTLRTAY